MRSPQQDEAARAELGTQRRVGAVAGEDREPGYDPLHFAVQHELDAAGVLQDAGEGVARWSCR